MTDSNWNVTTPIDHLKVRDIPGEIRSLESNIVTVLSKEHAAPSTANAGLQHLKGSAVVFLQSGLPTSDPEGNSLETSASTGDNGRLSINTNASNELRVYIATSAGVSTGHVHVRVGRLKLVETGDADGHVIQSVASGTQSGQAIHFGQVDTSSTGYLKLTAPSTTTGLFGVTVPNTPSNDYDIVSKVWAQGQLDSKSGLMTPAAYTGGESIVQANGAIVKFGISDVITYSYYKDITFGTAFPNTAVSAVATINCSTAFGGGMSVYVSGLNKTGLRLLLDNVDNNVSAPAYWKAIGY